MTLPQQSWANQKGEIFKRGDEVVIMQAPHIVPLMGRAKRGRVLGRVTGVGGGNVIVKPNGCKWTLHAYSNELEFP